MNNIEDQILQKAISSIYDKLLLAKKKNQKINFFDLGLCDIDNAIKEAVKNHKKAVLVTFDNDADLRGFSPTREKKLKSLC